MSPSGLDIKFKGAIHPIIISPTRVTELFEVAHKPEGRCVCMNPVWFVFKRPHEHLHLCLTGVHIGAGCSLSTVRSVLQKCVGTLSVELTQTYSALLEQLKHLGGEQIRNLAVSLQLHRHPSVLLFHLTWYITD